MYESAGCPPDRRHSLMDWVAVFVELPSAGTGPPSPCSGQSTRKLMTGGGTPRPYFETGGASEGPSKERARPRPLTWGIPMTSGSSLLKTSRLVARTDFSPASSSRELGFAGFSFKKHATGDLFGIPARGPPP